MRCRNCKEKFEPMRFNQKHCLKDECIRVFVEEAKAKAWKKTKAKMKTDLMTLQDYLKLAQITFNKYIRLRDKGNVCISCQKPPKKENAGHFFNANNHYNVRFDERNVHLQCEHCNTFLSGNLINYRENLLKKIGAEQFNVLEGKSKVTRKFTKEELKEIIETYKKKIKQYETQ
jgi:hypothetical protein